MNGEIISRVISLSLPPNRSAFLWGPRKVGKSYWIRSQLPGSPVIDLLKTDVFAEFALNPSLLRERYADYSGLIVIDEIQKVPTLLDEVHWMIENRSAQFLLTGSSARKLKKGGANLLGGRAWKRTMVPLCTKEIDRFDFEKIFKTGLLPSHFLSPNPIEDLRAYVSDYLKEEIAAEATHVNLPAFSEFLRVAALTSSELINYVNIGRESGASHKVVRHYFQILEDTYLASRLPAWRKSTRRKMITTEKFYLFDVGVTNYLARREPKLGSSEFGKSFEHFLFMELKAYQAYKNPDLPLYFWRSHSGLEVNFIIGEMETAVEAKGTIRVHDGHLKGLRALDSEAQNKIVVCLEKEPRKLKGNILVLPWQKFLEDLWEGKWDSRTGG